MNFGHTHANKNELKYVLSVKIKLKNIHFQSWSFFVHPKKVTDKNYDIVMSYSFVLN